MSLITYALLGLLVGVLLLMKRHGRQVHRGKQAPGPRPWPILGNLHLLRGHRLPYQGLIDLRCKFGDVFRLQLGAVHTLAVHGAENIRQILVNKGNAFDSRPNFKRYHRLFKGNKQNSLAFCDWSEVQRKRRDMLKQHTFPKSYTDNFQKLNGLICEEVKTLLSDIIDTSNNNVRADTNKMTASSATDNLRRLIKNKHVATIVRLPSLPRIVTKTPDQEQTQIIDIKQKLSATCGNVFLNYFCSTKFHKDDPEFKKFIQDFDKIFYEINQGYAYDFLPFLQIFYEKEIRKVEEYSESIRGFVVKNLVQDRLSNIQQMDSEDDDYLQSLLRNVKFGDDVSLDLETALFSLEDILGGHSAISNFLVKVLALIVNRQDIQEKVRLEVAALEKEFATLEDRSRLPYTESVIMEALRVVASPIVPHVANQDTEILGFEVPKDTLLLLNNYELNMSPDLWDEPERFEPCRFLDSASGRRLKPSHFLPFGGGRRSCMGYKLVQLFSVAFLSNLLFRFRVLPAHGVDYTECPIGNLALPTDTFLFRFELY